MFFPVYVYIPISDDDVLLEESDDEESEVDG
jgi:hypothetical protein